MPVLHVEGFDPFEVGTDDTLLDACEDHGVPMDSACGGFAACNSCRVEVIEGARNLSDRLEEEVPFLDAPGQRLGCQARIHGAVRVRLAPGLEVGR